MLMQAGIQMAEELETQKVPNNQKSFTENKKQKNKKSKNKKKYLN